MSAKKIVKEKDMPKMAGLSAPDDAWKGEDDFRTLMRAAEIHQDPERHGKAMKHAKKQKRAIKSLEDLKMAAADSDADDLE